MLAGSFLDVRDFPSPAKLAEHLLYLDHNDTAYNLMLHARHQVHCQSDWDFSYKTYKCRLCAYLHSHQGQTQVVPDVRTFWGIQQRCESPKLYYRGIADDVADRLNFSKIYGEDPGVD